MVGSPREQSAIIFTKTPHDLNRTYVLKNRCHNFQKESFSNVAACLRVCHDVPAEMPPRWKEFLLSKNKNRRTFLSGGLCSNFSYGITCTSMYCCGLPGTTGFV